MQGALSAIGLTVLVVDRDARARAQIVGELRRLGMHALGAYVALDAVALLDGIAAEVVLVRSDDEDTAMRYLRSRTILVRVPERATVEEAVERLLAALDQPGHSAVN